MYKLSMFQKFDFAAWQNDKSFMIQNVKYNPKKGCVSLDVIITERMYFTAIQVHLTKKEPAK